MPCLKKNIPDIFDCNLKTKYQILIIFGTNIPDNLPLNDCSVSHLTQCTLLHYLGKADQAKCALKETENPKNIPNINRALNKD